MRKGTRIATYAGVALVGFACAQPGHADTIHAMQGGGYYHHQSGWVFPEQVGEYSLVGVPGDINGTEDVAAYYARVHEGVRTVASVTVYPPNSAAPETKPASIKATPATVAISKQPRLRAARLTFKDGKTSRTTVYFIDTGAWIVKVRATLSATDKETAPALEAFARNQRWDSLQLSRESCTGPACT
jgi:hypothetical protein